MVCKTAALFSLNEPNLQVQYISAQLKNLNYSIIKLGNISNAVVSPQELEECLKESDITIIVGGIGSEFENQICQHLAKVFNEKIVINDKLIDLCASLKITSTGNTLRNAKLLQTTPVTKYPVIYVQGLILMVDDLDIIKQSFDTLLRPFLLNLNEKPDYKNDIVNKVYNSNYDHITNAINIIEDCFTRFGPQNVFMSFNGGKDCTVLLHLVLAVLKNKYPEYSNKLFCIYVEYSDPFPELTDFIRCCEEGYGLEVLTLSKNIKESLAFVLEQKPHMKACLMGTRRTDPFSENLKPFQMTDPDWPQIVRCSPILDWHYSDVWDYLLQMHVPYCNLYDCGYTSLGSSINTIKNPSLLKVTNNGETYLPAFKLLDATKERSGRNT